MSFRGPPPWTPSLNFNEILIFDARSVQKMNHKNIKLDVNFKLNICADTQAPHHTASCISLVTIVENRCKVNKEKNSPRLGGFFQYPKS